MRMKERRTQSGKVKFKEERKGIISRHVINIQRKRNIERNGGGRKLR